MKPATPPIFSQGAIAIAVSLLFQPQLLLANPSGAQVVNGTVNITRPNASTLNVTNTPGAIINWQGFSIGAGEVTRFIQQSSSSAVLNRVVGQDISSIQGQLLSNGRVFLINPAGILIGPNAMLDTAGFIGSTLNMQNADFLAGKLRFSGDANSGTIINQGWIRTSYGGNVLLVAPRIENSGLIQTPGGELILAAGQKLTVSSLEHEGVQFEVQAPTDAVVNVGKLLADGGAVGVFAGSLKHSGEIRANALVRDEGGKVVLKAANDIQIAAGSTIRADGKSGGAINVQSQAGTTLVSGEVSAKGSDGKGGDIRLLGNRVGVLDNAVIDASGERGGGQVLVGGDYQGKNPDIQNAARATIGTGAILRADAKSEGDGGRVIVWSDEITRVYGEISARGGAQSGNGGLVETSGKQGLTVGDSARVDIGAPAGFGGTWLLDPHNITVQTGGPALVTDVDQFADTPAADQTISPAAIGAVASGTVLLLANNDITFVDPVTLTNNVGLTAEAGRSILVNANITANNANLNLVANYPVASGVVAANRDAGAATLTMASAAAITATNGNVTLQIANGAGHAATSGNLVVSTITAKNVYLYHQGPTANGSILSTGASSMITANSILMDSEGPAGAGASIGTSLAPMRVTTTNLDAHHHLGTGGIYIDSPTQGLQIGGSFFANAMAINIRGVQTTSGGPLSITANGPITQVTGTAGCGLTGGTGGPICAGAAASVNPADVLTLRATDMNLFMPVAGNSVILLPQAGGTIGMGGAAGTLQLSNAEIGFVNTTSLRIGEAASGNIVFGGNITMPGTSSTIDFRSGGTITTLQGVGTTDIKANGPTSKILLTASTIGATGAGRIKLDPGAGTVTTNSTNGGTLLEQSVGDLVTGNYSFQISGSAGTLYPLELATTNGNITGGFSSAGAASLDIRLIAGGAGNVALNGTGTINSTAFTLSPSATGSTTFDGGTTFNTPVTSNRPIVFQGGNANFNGAVNLNNTLTMNSGTATFNQPVNTTNSISVGGGTAAFNNTVNATTTSGFLTVSSGSATFAGTSTFGGLLSLGAGTGLATFNGTTVFFNGAQIHGGTLAGSGSVTSNNGMTWTAGAISNTGGVIVTPGSGGLAIATGAPTLTGKFSTDLIGMAPGSNFTIGANGVLTLSGATTSSTNGGTLTIANTGAMLITGKGGLSMNGPGGLTINAGGLLDFQNDASIVGAGGLVPTVANSGTVRKSAGTGISRIGLPGGTAVTFTHAPGATIDVLTGTLQAGSGFATSSGNIKVATGSTFSTNNGDLLNTGIISGNGTIDVGAGKTLTNNGFIRPGASPGALAIIGDLTLTGGTVDIEVQSPGTFPAHHDRITVSGTANLGGILSVTNLSGFAPPTGQSYTIMNYGARTGDFATQNFPPGFTYAATPNASSYLLSVTGGAAPSSSSSSSSTPEITNTVVADRNRIVQAVPDDDGEHGEAKIPPAAPQCT